MNATDSFFRSVSTLLLLMFAWCLAEPNSVAQAQGITLSVSSSPLSVQLGGTQEVMGGVRLTAGPAPGPTLTQISTLQIWYQGVSISNPFAGTLPITLPSGVIVHPDGIVITFTGGYNHPAVTASVFNSTLGTNPVGVVTLSFPGGLPISPGDFIEITGLRANVSNRREGDKIDCLILAAPTGSHLVNIVSTTVAQVVNSAFRITTTSLADALIGTGYSQQLVAAGGTPPYLWQVTQGSLPTPLSLDFESGFISGGPAVGGVFSFVVQVTDKTDAKVSKSFTIHVQGLSFDRSGLDVGEALVGTSLTRPINITNVGTTAQDVTTNLSGSSAYSVSPASFRVEAGKIQRVNVTLTPTNDNGGVPVFGQVNFFFSGLVRFVTLSGKGKVLGGPPVTILPSSGPTVGNTRIRVRGTLLGSFSSLALGGVVLSQLTQVGTDDWSGFVGAHAVGAADLMITRPDGSVVTIPSLYRYVELPKASRGPGDLCISFVSDTVQFRSNLGINNPSSEAGSVAILLVDSNGLIVAQKTVSIGANGMLQLNHILRYLEDADDVTGREGSLLLRSNRPIRAWASQIDNASLDPSLQRAASQGAVRVLVPSSVVSERFSTALVINNLADREAKVRIVAREKLGTPQLTLEGIAIPSQGFVYFEDFYRANNLSQATGPIEIESEQGIQLTALARIYSQQSTGGFFPGVPLDSPTRAVVIPHVLDTAEFRTNLGVNNLGSRAAEVKITLTGIDGVPLGTFSDLIPAGALVQWDNIQRLLLGSSVRTESEGWLRIESDQEIVAWVSQIDNTSQDPDFLTATRVSSSRLLIPAAVSAGAFRSTLVILNGDSAPNPVTLTARSPEGGVRLTRSVTIPGSGLLRYADILDSLGLGGTFGPLEITSPSGKPILAISRVSSDQHTGGLLRTEDLP